MRSGVISYGVPFVSDTVAPRVRILPGKAAARRGERARAAHVRDRRPGAATRGREGGDVRIPWAGPAAKVRVVAWDAAGNASGPVVRVRRGD